MQNEVTMTEEKKNKGGRPAGLTNRQKEFARYYVEGVYSNAECARKAGYAEESAAQHAAKLLDGKSYPHVPVLIKELREQRERKYGVSLGGQLKRLHELSRGAEESGQFSAAINAEKIRSALGGLTIDRREQNHVHQLDSLSREEIVARLAELRKQFPTTDIEGDYKVVTDAEDRESPMELIEAETSTKDPLPEA